MDFVGAVAAAFTGAVVGVVGQAWWTRRHDEARLRSEKKAGARLVRAELQLATAAIAGAMREDAWTALETLRVETWRSHGVTLAGLPSEDFDAVAEACTKVMAAADHARLIGQFQRRLPLFSSLKVSQAPEAMESMGRLLELCDRAIEILGPVAYPREQLSAWPPADRLASPPVA